MKIGDLFYWNKRVLVEYVGMENNRHIFRSENGGIIKVKPENLDREITQ